MFKVTYFNVLDGKRHTLIDDISEEKADEIVAHFGNPANKFDYLPEVRKQVETPTEKNHGI